MESHRNSLAMRKTLLALTLVVLYLFLGCEAQPPEIKDHRVKVKIDKTVVITREGPSVYEATGSGVSRSMMSMVHHPDGSIFLNTKNVLFKSTDNAQTWTPVPLKLTDVPPNQHQIGIGVTRAGRLLMVHQDSGTVGNLYGQSLYVSYSDDGGKTWKKSSTDFGKIPPGIPNMHFHEDGVRTFIEQPDGTLMFTTTITPAGDYRKKYPPKSPQEPPNYQYGGKEGDLFSDIVFRSTDGGLTWGDPTQVYPDLNPHETAMAIDPHNPDHILVMTRIQRDSGPGEDAEQMMKETGNPMPQYKQGTLFESTDGGRTFQLAKGGMTSWYGHRGTIYWSPNDVVVVTHNHGGSGHKRKVIRISLNGGKTWVDGTKAGTPFMNKSANFLLAPAVGFTSPTIELSKNHFFSTAYLYPSPYDDWTNPTQLRETIVGVFWHLEKSPSIPAPYETMDYWRSIGYQVDFQKTNFLEIGPLWKIRRDPQEVGLEEKWYSEETADSEWTEVHSNSLDWAGWHPQGIGNSFIGYTWYRARFKVPEDFFAKTRNLICFGGVNAEAEIYINGKKVFEHTSQSTGVVIHELWNLPFSFDVRPELDLKVGEENLMAVRVRNQNVVGGIWKPVHLLSSDDDLEKYLWEVIQEIKQRSGQNYYK